MIDDWINSLSLDFFDCAKLMMIEGKQFRQKAYPEYETTSLRNPYRIIALMLNRIFGWANGKFYKLRWILLIHHVATQGTIFNWVDIIAKNLSSWIATAQGGMNQRKS